MVTATFRDGKALICVIPSKTQDGVYLVRVEPEGQSLLVSHSCPAYRYKNRCGHIDEAVECYRNWRFWEQDREVVSRHQPITLQPTWVQIPIPVSIEEVAEAALGENSRAS